MIIKRTLYKILLFFKQIPYKILDRVYISLDKNNIRRTRNIRQIPKERYRKGGKYSYAEWAHVIGIFQTLINQNIGKRKDSRILDVGCGTGLLAIASEPFLETGGQYVGIDVVEKDIKFCRNHYDPKKFRFDLLKAGNPAYNPGETKEKQRWDLEDNSFDLVTALSVWTHLDEEDAIFYFNEIERVLKPGGKAIITFFLLNSLYKNDLNLKGEGKSKFHMTLRSKWIFNVPVKNSDSWFYPEWAEVPEKAIGISEKGMERLVRNSGLKILSINNGSWKEIPGIYFQDVVVFEKPDFS